MPSRQQIFGKEAEAAAAALLMRNGYRILERNYRTRAGEIDIVADDNGTIVFVEVKARRSERFGSPKWAVTPAKQRKLSMAALHYLKAARRTGDRARFDVVSISGDRERLESEIIKNAFELAYT